MIKTLHIENYALIDRLDIGFGSGFSVITGETGAGKSIMLGALGLLCGARAESKAVKQGERRCVVEALFDIKDYGLEPFFESHDLEFDGQECLMRREVQASGKSRGFINDTPVTAAAMKELGDRLIDIHSQHQNLLLGREDFQTNVLDALAGNADLLGLHAKNFAALKAAEKALREAEEALRKGQEEADYLRFQFSQLDEANLQSGEQEELESELGVLEHAEEIKQQLYAAQQAIEGDGMGETGDVLTSLKAAESALQSVGDKLPDAQQLAERVSSCLIELKDVCAEVEAANDRVDYNPQRLEEVNDRLSTIYTLQKKHHTESVDELIALRDSLSERLSLVDDGEERLEALQKAVEANRQAAVDTAKKLSAARTKAAKQLEREMVENLQPLGMPNVRFEAQVTLSESLLSAKGADSVDFRFNANKGGALQELGRVASGGEMARVMLVLKALLARATQLPTIIFDEIDTGVSGAIAEKMARMMQDMSQNGRQVISITHLPQIAARGQKHYHVFKTDTESGTTSQMAELAGEARVEEIAHMLSGEQLTQAARDNARELLSGL